MKILIALTMACWRRWSRDAARRRGQDRGRGGGEFLRQRRATDRRRPGIGRQHSEQSRSRPAPVRDFAGGRPPNRGRASRRLQRRRLRSLDRETAQRRRPSRGASRSSPPTSCTERRGQSAPLVRSVDHAGGRAARSPPRSPRPIPAHKDEYAARLKTFLASLRAAERQDRRHSRQICRHGGHGDRAGLWLHGGKRCSLRWRTSVSSSPS